MRSFFCVFLTWFLGQSSLGQEIWDLKFHQNGELFAAGDSSGGVRVYSLNDMQPIAEFFHSNRFKVYSVTFSQSGHMLVSSSRSGEIIQWDWRHERKMATFATGGGYGARVAWFGQSWLLATNSHERLLFWEVQQPSNFGEIPIKSANGIVALGDEPFAVTSSLGGLQLWDFFKGEVVKTIDENSHWSCVALSANTGILLTAGRVEGKNLLRIWQGPRFGLKKEIQIPGAGIPWNCSISPDGRLGGVSLLRRASMIWDLSTGDLLLQTQPSYATLSLAISDSDVVVGTASGEILKYVVP